MNSYLIKATAQSETSPELNSYGNELPVKVHNTQSVLTKYDIINLLSYQKKQLMDHLQGRMSWIIILLKRHIQTHTHGAHSYGSTAPVAVNGGNSSNICDSIQW